MIPLRSASFRWLWCSTLASAGAQGLERTATAWLAYEVSGSALAVVATCYLAVAAMSALGAALVWSVRVAPAHAAGTIHPPFRRALGDAARLIVSVPTVRLLSIAGIAAEIFAFSHGTALPVLAREVLAAGPEGLGTLNAAASIGGTAAVVLLSVLPGRVGREPILGAVVALSGVRI